MRIVIKLTSGKEPVPFNYQPYITGAIHKWIGKNDAHDEISLYSFSWLNGGKMKGNGLVFDNGASFDFSSHDNNLIRLLIAGIQADPVLNFGLIVSDIALQETPIFSNKSTFFASSPILVKRKIENSEVHYTYDNPESDEFLTETLITKLKKAGLKYDSVIVRFKRDYPGSKTKLIYYRKIGNKVSFCPVTIEGTSEQIAFAWNVGVGNSTGIGFGALK